MCRKQKTWEGVGVSEAFDQMKLVDQLTYITFYLYYYKFVIFRYFHRL